MEAPPPVEDQARLLEDALSVVRQQAAMMRKCLETPGKLMDALKCRYVFNVAGQMAFAGCLVLTSEQLYISIGTANKQSGSEAIL